jgi:hypothetical protein
LIYVNSAEKKEKGRRLGRSDSPRVETKRRGQVDHDVVPVLRADFGNGTICDWLDHLTRKRTASASDQCHARCPVLLKVVS